MYFLKDRFLNWLIKGVISRVLLIGYNMGLSGIISTRILKEKRIMYLGRDSMVSFDASVVI